MAYVLPSPSFVPQERDGYVLVAGPRATWVVRVRRVDIDAVRAEAIGRTEWWLGPSSPPDAEATLVAAGFVRDEVPTLTGMTCVREPPATRGVEVRAATAAEVFATEREVWGSEPSPPPAANDVEHHFAALVEGELAGTARAVDMQNGVALMGGVVRPVFRRRGVYRALVRARWEHAVARKTPLLVVQAGDMSAPVLDGLGFERHCELRLFVDVRGQART